MKRNLLIIVALALLASMAASAQSINMRVAVPFDFIVDRISQPAGQYALVSLSDAGRILALRNLDSRTTKLLASDACTSGAPASATKLVFHRYGHSYFLSEIWTEGNDLGRQLPKGQREREVARDYSMKEVVLVALK